MVPIDVGFEIHLVHACARDVDLCRWVDTNGDVRRFFQSVMFIFGKDAKMMWSQSWNYNNKKMIYYPFEQSMLFNSLEK